MSYFLRAFSAFFWSFSRAFCSFSWAFLSFSRRVFISFNFFLITDLSLLQFTPRVYLGRKYTSYIMNKNLHDFISHLIAFHYKQRERENRLQRKLALEQYFQIKNMHKMLIAWRKQIVMTKTKVQLKNSGSCLFGDLFASPIIISHQRPA